MEEKEIIESPNEDWLRKIDVHTLLPQQEPFVMIGKLVHFDMKKTVSETQITESNVFLDNGKMASSGMVENVAQTCAARIGFINKYILKKEIQLGFIGAVRNMEFYDNPVAGDTITTTIEVIEDVFGMILAEAKIERGEKLLAEGQIKIAIQG